MALLACLALLAGLLLLAPLAASANPITVENANAGSVGWERDQADAPPTAPGIEGYASKTSVAPGEAINFHVRTSSNGLLYRVIIYRLGWYGGAGARQMTCLPSCVTNGTGSTRTVPNPNAQTGLIDANWPSSQSLTIPANWVSGEYVAEFVIQSNPNAGVYARYYPFVVRSTAATPSDYLVVVPTNTYNAYNNWGGTSAYENNTDHSIYSGDHATKESFNRPYARREWRFWDYPLLRYLEREGFDVSYVSEGDVDANPSLLVQHRAVLVSGHAEYWTKGMRNGYESAIAQGTNVSFWGANDAYWQVRLEDSSCSPGDTVCAITGNRRTTVNYKTNPDPTEDPADDTIQFRDLDRPECSLMGGVQYGGFLANDGYRDYTVTQAGADDAWFQGTGLTQGSTVTGIMGFEFDSFWPGCETPAAPTVLMTYDGPEVPAQAPPPSPDVHDAAAVKYETPGSGARVFSSGSAQWSWALDSYRWDPIVAGVPTDTRVQDMTHNMLDDMGSPSVPAGIDVTHTGDQFNIQTFPRGSDPRVTGYKIYRHSGTADFEPGDAGVTLVCQNATGACSDSPATGTYRYATVAVDTWADSSPRLSLAVTHNLPVAVDDSATMSEDAVATAINVLANDTDVEGDPIRIASRTQPTNGNVVLTGGTPGAHTGLTYQPNANYCNTPPGTSPDTFTYTVNGGDTATVSVTVNCVDDPPVAVDDTATVNEGAAATAINVLSNDTDDGGTKLVASRTQPANGNVVITGGGTGLTYQPNVDYCNNPPGSTTDNFTYTLNGGSSATVRVTVTCNPPPTARNDAGSVMQDASASAVNVLANDINPGFLPMKIISVTQSPGGQVAITGGGTGLTYQPNSGFCNNPGGSIADKFTYILKGGSSATVSMTVFCVSSQPTAVDDAASVNQGAGATAVNVLANDTNPGGSIAIASATQPANGTVALTGGSPGAHTGLTYQPNANYCNNPPGSSTDDFTYTLTPGGSTATVRVTVNCPTPPQPPTARNDAAVVTEDDPATAVNVFANDLNPAAGPMQVVAVTQSPDGQVAITGGGSGVSYQPNPDFCNNPTGSVADKFTYTLNGGSTAKVSMTVYCVDDGPLAPLVQSFSTNRSKLQVASPRRVPITFTYTLSAAATVKVRIFRLRRGRKVLAGALRAASRAGGNSIRFSGRLGGRTIKPGAYKAALTATDAAGKSSAPESLRFKVIRR